MRDLKNKFTKVDKLCRSPTLSYVLRIKKGKGKKGAHFVVNTSDYLKATTGQRGLNLAERHAKSTDLRTLARSNSGSLLRRRDIRSTDGEPRLKLGVRQCEAKLGQAALKEATFWALTR